MSKELLSTLTDRQLEIVENIVLFGNIKEVALSMKISARTVECHFNNIKRKLGIHYKYQLNRLVITSLYMKHS